MASTATSAPLPPLNNAAPASSTSIAASRPRRSSSNNNNNNNSIAATTRSSSMNRQAGSSNGNGNGSSTGTSPSMATRSRGLSGSGTSPYSSSPTYNHHLHHSIADDRRQSKFEKLFGSATSGTSSSRSSHDGTSGNGFAGLGNASFGNASSGGSSNGKSNPTVAKSGIALTRRTSGASSAQKPVGISAVNSSSNTSKAKSGSRKEVYNSSKQLDEEVLDEDGDDEAGASSFSFTSSSKKNGNGVDEDVGDSSTFIDKELLRCERCHKVYHHPQSLIKHRWQHTEMWSDASKYGLSKHQTVQALEAAVILANPDTLRLLPNDRSHWPAAVSPPTSGLLGSEKLNIEILRKQAEVNERELAEQEKAGTLRPSGGGAYGMQMYSKSMPANVGRRRSGLAFSFQQEMMDENEEEEEAMSTEAGDDDDEDDEGDDDNQNIDVDVVDMRTTGGDNDDDDDSTESEDESVIASATKQHGAMLLPQHGGHSSIATAAAPSTTDMDSMDQDMFSLDISSSSPYMRSQVLPLAGSAAAGNRSSMLSYSRKSHHQQTPSIGPSAERYTFLPTIPSSSSLHMSADGFSSGGMSAIPTTSSNPGGISSSSRNRSSSHTRSTKNYDTVQERSMRENSTSSSTDESGASASANEGTNTTPGSGDESHSYATRDSGYVSNGHPRSVQNGFANGDSGGPATKLEGFDEESTAAALYTLSGAAGAAGSGGGPNRPHINPTQTTAISMSAPVLGFFTERSPASSYSNRGIQPTRQQVPRDNTIGRNSDLSPTKQLQLQDNALANASSSIIDPATSQATAIPDFSPLEAQAAEILSSSHHSQQSLSSGPGPRSYSQQTHLGSYNTRSPGFHPYRSSSPFLPSSRQLPSSFAQAQAQQISASPSPSPAAGQAYSFGQAPLGSSFRSTSFTGNGHGNSYHPKQSPLSPLARPVDANGDGPSPEVDDDEIMDMDL